MAGKVAPVNCPKCGGPMWDNIEGKRNPKAPDYACKDKQNCGAGVWLKDAEKAALATVQSPTRQNGAPPTHVRPQIILDKMMKACVEAAQRITQELFVDGETKGVDHALTINMATTLYIARCRNEGILEVEKEALAKLAARAAEKAAAEAEAQRKREEEERSRQASMSQTAPWEPNGYNAIPALVQGDDDLPF